MYFDIINAIYEFSEFIEITVRAQKSWIVAT